MSAPRGRGTGARGNARARGPSITRGGNVRGNGGRGRGQNSAATRDIATARSSHFSSKNTFQAAKQNGQSGAFNGAQSQGSFAQRYEQLERFREQERKHAVASGLIADPNTPRALADAITPVGTCQTMCAEFERVERVVQNDVWAEEKEQNHSGYSTREAAQPDESRFVKKFRRAAAGVEEQLPSDLRPPAVLKTTCDYLFNDLIGQADNLAKVHHFVWDRTRAIRNDFSIQQVSKPGDLSLAIECYERIARFHILSLHQLAVYPRPYDKYNEQQEREQLDRTLLSLMQYYDDSRSHVSLPNEAEFRAYCIIFQLQDPQPDLEDRAQSWPREVLMDGRVRVALDLYAHACNTIDVQGPLKPRANHVLAQQDWEHFWTAVESKKVSYLMACVAEIYFNLVRRTTLEGLWRGYRQSQRTSAEDFTIPILQDLFRFDEEEQVVTFCEAYGFSFATRVDGEQFLNLVSVRKDVEFPQPNIGLPKQWKSEVVEYKRVGRTLPAVIDGMCVKRARDMGMVVEELPAEEEGMQDVERLGDCDDQAESQAMKHPFQLDFDPGLDSDSLFIPENTAVDEHAEPQSIGAVLANSTLKANPFASAKPLGQAPTNNSFDAKKLSGLTPNPFAPSSNTTSSTTSNTFGQPSKTSPFAPVPNTASTPAATGTGESIWTSGKTGFNFTAPPPPAPKASTTGFDFTAPPAPKAGASVFDFAAKPSEPLALAQKSGETCLDITAKPVVSSLNTPSDNTTGFSFAAKPAENSSAAATASVFDQKFTGLPAGFSFSPAPTSTATLDNMQSVLSKPQAPARIGLFQNIPQPAVDFTPTSPEEAEAPVVNTNAKSATSHASQAGFQPSQFAFTNTNATKEQKLLPSLPESHGISQERRDSIGRQHKPKVPSPLHKSSSFETFESASATSQPPPTAAQIFERLAREILEDSTIGYLQQYLEYTIEQTIKQTQAEERAELSEKEAEEGRWNTIAKRYLRRWRATLWRSKSTVRANARRQRARRGLEESKSDRGSDMGSIIIRTRASTMDSEQGGAISQQSGRNGVGYSHQSSERQVGAGSKRPLSTLANSIPATREPSHKRQKSVGQLKGTSYKSEEVGKNDAKADLLRRSAFLSGSSPYQGPVQQCTTQTNYFRLKAMGIDAATNISEARGTKRGRSESIDNVYRPPATRTAPIVPATLPKTSALKAMMPPPATIPKNDDADEALFARLKKAREALAESGTMVREMVAKETELRCSLSASRSSNSNDSPSMIKARAEARWRASRPDSTEWRQSQSEVPAYRLRASRFVPPEQYGRAVERAKTKRAERSGLESRFDDSAFDRSLSDLVRPVAHDDVDRRSGSGQALLRSNGMVFPELLGDTGSPEQSQPLGHGIAHSQLPKWEPPAPAPAPAPAVTQQTNTFTDFTQSQSPWGTVNGVGMPAFYPATSQVRNGGKEHTPLKQQQLEMSPFDATVTQAVDGVSEHASPGESAEFALVDGHAEQSMYPPLPVWTAENHTIQPSQIEASLGKSFDHAATFTGWNGGEPSINHAGFPPLERSHVAAQAVSLISGDGEGEVDAAPLGYAAAFAHPTTNASMFTPEPDKSDDMLDPSLKAEIPDSYQYTQNFSNNSYAALADEYAGDTEEDAEPEDETAEQEALFEDEAAQDSPQRANSFLRARTYEDEEAGGDAGDTEEYPEESDAEAVDDQGPLRSFIEEEEGVEYDSEEEYDSAEDEEEDEMDGFDQNAARGGWVPPLPPVAQKTTVLQTVGNTETDAIELSD
ncbi:hypothetical protein LTR62_006964 [Meristemomyces frigidus]|uniref:SAC3/GANP/THP3 conserved domain-containing protein n=1 Tax=Meristemomyces frigidus TaxID=1508187 RepID=A0AAN7TD68_9PEZI|nr:hypothetical protein LTR62_006964 [Meristemomyces frigidus]